MSAGAEDPLDIAALVGRALDASGVPYYLTGSIAAGVLGQPRFTRDIDFVVSLRKEKLDPLARALGADFDVDQEALLEAVRRRSSWNIFHLPTMTRIDLFVLKDDAYETEKLARRRPMNLGKGRSLDVLTAEDAILSKLLWFKSGAESDGKQLQDVIDVMRVQAGQLDDSYLDAWASKLAVGRLLERVRKGAGYEGRTDPTEYFGEVRDLLAGGPRVAPTPKSSKVFSIVTSRPCDVRLFPAGLRVRWESGQESDYFADTGPGLVSELLNQLRLTRVEAPTVGLLEALPLPSGPPRTGRGVWLVPVERELLIFVRDAPSEPPPANGAIPPDGPWRLPQLFQHVSARPKNYQPNTGKFACPACGAISEQHRVLSDSRRVCPECGGSFAPPA